VSVKVLVLADIDPDDAARFEEAYLQVAARMKGTPGLFGDQLLRDVGGDGRYVLLSEWEDERSFQKWHEEPNHTMTTAPMRPFWAGRPEPRVLSVAARLESVD